MKKEFQKNIIITLILSVICAVQGFVALSASIEPIEIWEKKEAPIMERYALGVFILFLLVFAVALLSKRVPIALGICSLAINILALINYYEILFHGTVTTFQDIWNIPTVLNVIGAYEPQFGWPVYLITATILPVCLILIFIGKRNLDFRRHIIAGTITVALFFVSCWYAVFAPFAPAGSTQWNWEMQYYKDSYVLGMLNSIKAFVNPVMKPDGYSPEKIAAEEGFAGRRKSYPDIIVILNESWYNPDHFMDFGLNTSVTKNYDALDAYKGYAAVPNSGGGTNGSEFELLTSNSMQIINSSAPFNTMGMNNARSIVDYLESLGYCTLAAHCDSANNYRRNTAWKAMGFDHTYFRDEFTDKKQYGDRYFYTDSSAFENFKRFYNDLPEGQPRFAYLLTMQNHGGYEFNRPEWDTVHISNYNGLSSETAEWMNEYLSSVKLTDEFIGELKEWISASDRDIIVYMVGDHCPPMISSMTDESVANSENDLKKRQTPYLIYSNFKIVEMPSNNNIDLCALTPYVLKAADLPLSPYYRKLLEISEDVQCFTNVDADTDSVTGGFISVDGSIRKAEEYESLMKYYYMEFNNLKWSERNDLLFEP